MKQNQDINLKKEIENFYLDLEPSLKELETNIQKLKDFDITKRKVDERTRNITEIGRSQYIQILEVLINQIRTRKEKNPIHRLAKEINNFVKQEARAEIKASQIIGKEIQDIKKTLNEIKKRINELFQKAEEITSEENKLERIKTTIQELKNLEENISNLEKETKDLEKQNKEISKNIEKRQKETENKKTSEVFREYQDKKEIFKKLEKELNKIQLKLKEYLNEKIFIKYLHSEGNSEKTRLIKEYTSNPLETLLEDENLEILKYLKEIVEKTQTDKLNLKENEKIKIVESEKNLRDTKENWIEIKNKISQIEKEIKNAQIEKELVVLETKNTQEIQLKQLNEERKNKLIKILQQNHQDKDRTKENLNNELSKNFNILLSDS